MSSNNLYIIGCLDGPNMLNVDSWRSNGQMYEGKVFKLNDDFDNDIMYRLIYYNQYDIGFWLL